jgi:hypothetical protein
MKQIRRNVFETNSSSTHSVSIAEYNLEPSHLDIVEYDERCDYRPGIIVDTVGFCGWYDHETQSDKLAYLMQQVAYINGYSDIFWSSENLEERLADYYDCDDFKELEEQVCEYTGAKCLRFGSLDGYIDHDSVVYDIYELKDEVNNDYINFIFNPKSYVHFEFLG